MCERVFLLLLLLILLLLLLLLLLIFLNNYQKRYENFAKTYAQKMYRWKPWGQSELRMKGEKFRFISIYYILLVLVCL